jgi:uncharacterized membrane protein
MKGSFTEMAQDLAAKAFDCRVNMDDTERIVSAVGGGALLLTSSNLRSLRGLLATAVGASLIYRGMTGRCPFYSVLGMKTCGQTSLARQHHSNSRERAGVSVD